MALISLKKVLSYSLLLMLSYVIGWDYSRRCENLCMYVEKVEDTRRYFHTMDLSTSVIIRRRRLERAARSHY